MNRDRRRYNPVSSSGGGGRQHRTVATAMEEIHDVDDDSSELLAAVEGSARNTNTNTNNNNSRRPRLSRRYNRIATSGDDEDDDDEEANRILASAESEDAATTASSSTGPFVIDDDDDDDDNNKETTTEKTTITITVLDFAQSRFQVPACPDWTVGRFKQAGAKIHKVVASRQRLIYRGKMLERDETATLQDYGIAQDGLIVHLFPKPRVVITNNNNNNEAGACANSSSSSSPHGDDEDEDEEQGGGGARVPTIVMDAEEAERRSQILVLGSTDFIEAQNNVKLFSFMLLIISSIELLNLFSIAMGVPQTTTSSSGGDYSGNMPGMVPPQDDFNGATNHTTASHYGGGMSDADAEHAAAAELISHWGPAQYVDTVVSLLGVYVALLGLKASTENTLRLARVYLLGLLGTGTLWLLYNFFFTAAIEHKMEEHKEEQHRNHSHSNSNDEDDDNFVPRSDSDIYNQAFQVMMLPALVWIMCCLRAWQFQHLLYEAEAEAEDRIQAQLRMAQDEEEEEDDEEEASAAQAHHGSNTPQQPQPHEDDEEQDDEELALRNGSAVLT